MALDSCIFSHKKTGPTEAGPVHKTEVVLRSNPVKTELT